MTRTSNLNTAKMFMRNAKISLNEGDIKSFVNEFKEMRVYLHRFRDLVREEENKRGGNE